MSIRVTCTKCHTRFNVSEKFAGKEGPCPKCKTKIRVPDKSEDVVIEAPASAGPTDSTGRAVLEPVKRTETSLSIVQWTLIIGSIVCFLVVALILRFSIEDVGQFPLWLMVVSAVVIAPPLIFVAYTFLREQELDPYRGKELQARVGICAVVYPITWLAMPVACFAFNDNYETGSYIAAGIAMIFIGGFTGMFCFDFDFLMGSVHYGLYLGACLFGRFLSGVGLLPVTPGKLPDASDFVSALHWELGLELFNNLCAILS
ncbi:MAG: hypothetical protein ACKVHR_16025 [Pirellulales bacterium]|jgi:hypothetical protein